MPSCCVPGCKSRFVNNNSNIQFFSFPSKRPEQCALWTKAIGRENWQFTKWSKICSLHFTQKDFSPRFPGVIGYLRRDAIPSQLIQTTGIPEIFETDYYQNGSITGSRFFATTAESNAEAAQSEKTIPTPIALIKVAVQEMSNSLISRQELTEPNGREPNADIDGKRTEALILSHEESEASSILPHEGDDSPISEKSPEPLSILPHSEADESINENGPEPVSSFSHKVSNPVVRTKKNIGIVKPQKMSEPVRNEHRTRAENISSCGVSNAAGKERTTEPINKFIVREKTTESTNPATQIVKRLRPMSSGDKTKSDNFRKIKSKPKSSRLESRETVDTVETAGKDVNVDSEHHTIRIIPVEASDPILAIHCPLSCQETYVALPIRSLVNKNSCAMEIAEDQTAREKSLNVDDEVLRQKENFNESSSEIEALKKEIVKLNQTIGRQRKRLQCLLQMRGSTRRQRSNRENTNEA